MTRTLCVCSFLLLSTTIFNQHKIARATRVGDDHHGNADTGLFYFFGPEITIVGKHPPPECPPSIFSLRSRLGELLYRYNIVCCARVIMISPFHDQRVLCSQEYAVWDLE